MVALRALGKSVGKKALQHLSIILAFCAVFGLAAYRVLDSQPANDNIAGLETRYTATIPQKRPEQHAQPRDLSSLLKRVAAVEAELRQVRSDNQGLQDQIRQLVARDSIVTSSVRKRSTIPAGGFRTSTVPAQNGGSLPRAQGGSLGIHLATFADPAALTVAWNSLKDGEEAMLSQLSPFARSIISASGDTLYRLIAGPVPTRNEAVSLCQRLKARNRFCKVSQKLGTPLAQVLAQN